MISVKASVSSTTTVSATLGFQAESGDLFNWSQIATSPSGGIIHLAVQNVFIMNTTSSSIIYILTSGSAYDSTLDVLRVQLSAVLLGPVVAP